MGIGFIAALVVGAIVGGIVIASMSKGQVQGDEMAPATLDSFQVTQVTEGSIVPLIYGRVRTNSNLIWFGNLQSEEITESIQGGKGGGGSQDITVGYAYYLDLWHGICLGKINLISLYVNDKPRTIEDLGGGTYAMCTNYAAEHLSPLVDWPPPHWDEGAGPATCDQGSYFAFNNGEGDFYPTTDPQYANKLPGVAHAFFERFYLGANITFVPSIHWVVEKLVDSPLNYADLTNGSNPAAIIYDLLFQGGAIAGQMDLTSFQDAADYWYTKGMGLNISFTRRDEVQKHILKIRTYVDFSLYKNANNQYVLKAWKDSDVAAATLDQEDFLSFTFTRRSWHDTYNDFRANYVDDQLDYSKRTLRAMNMANYELLDYKKQKTIDLTAFRTKSIAEKRLWEIMKRDSYPEAQIKFSTNMSYANLNVGDVIEVNYTDYGVANAEFRIVQKDVPEADSNEIEWAAVQLLEGLWDDVYQDGGLVDWQAPSVTPLPMTHQKIFELPYNQTYGRSPAYIVLAHRERQEDQCAVLWSPTGTDFNFLHLFKAWSLRGTLDEAYTEDTVAIDDEIGLLFTPYKDTQDFANISREELFTRNRFALVNDEMMAFQYYAPEGANSYRLGGVIRGIYNTPVQTHGAGSEIWITNVKDNILTNVENDTFYVKLLPVFQDQSVGPSDATAITVNLANKGRTPWPIGRVVVNRYGATSLSVEVWPSTQIYEGAGRVPPNAQNDQYPFQFEGDIHVYDSHDDINQWYPAGSVWPVSWTQAESLGTTVYVAQRIDGYVGPYVTVNVGTVLGDYVGPLD